MSFDGDFSADGGEMGKAPAFQFYAADFLIGTFDMTPEEVGVYIRLLAFAWDKGPLPKSTERLAVMCGMSERAFLKVWDVVRGKWTETEAGWVNDRLEGQRLERERYAERQAEKGRQSGLARRTKHEPETNRGSTTVQPETNRGSTAVEPETNSSIFDLRSSKRESTDHSLSTRVTRVAFTEFWALYPRKQGKGEAERIWQKLKVSPDLWTQIRTAIQRQCRLPQWQRDGGQYIPHPATWLRQRRWEDDPDPDLSAPSPPSLPSAEDILRRYDIPTEPQ